MQTGFGKYKLAVCPLIQHYLLGLQETLCKQLSLVDGAVFQEDPWQRMPSGHGKTCVLQEGAIFEKAAVNFSHIEGQQLPPSATAKRPELAGQAFEVMGLSLILHPRNPYIPTTHANLRFFNTVSNQDNIPVWWFGGGFDLTPYYGFIEDCIHWHQTAKMACDPFGLDLYPLFKQWADQYFFLTHRNESRGIGGLFFDDFNQQDIHYSFDFMKSVGDYFLKAYLPIVHRRKNMPYGQKERDFQTYRRGRYAEFNLLYDRGTLFGLQSGGRVESILASLPPVTRWIYDYQPEKDSPEDKLISYFLKAKDWLSIVK